MSIKTLKEEFNSLTLESEGHWDYRGTRNSERDYVHGVCTYPAMMVPKMQREMLDVCLAHLQGEPPCVIDPFAGSGTILVEGMLRGLDIVGVDVNPLSILLCKVKTTILKVGNEEVESWLRKLLSKNAEFEFHALKMPDGAGNIQDIWRSKKTRKNRTFLRGRRKPSPRVY